MSITEIIPAVRALSRNEKFNLAQILLEDLASVSFSQGDYSTARALSEESVVFSRRTKRKDRIAYALHGLASEVASG